MHFLTCTLKLCALFRVRYCGSLYGRVISGFRLEVDETCALVGYYAASSHNSLRRFGQKYLRTQQFSTL